MVDGRLESENRLEEEDLARCFSREFHGGGISIGNRPWTPVVIERDGGNKTATSKTRGGRRSRRIRVIDLVRRERRMNGTGTAGRDRRRREQEVQSNDSGSLINFIRSNFSCRVIHHGGI